MTFAYKMIFLILIPLVYSKPLVPVHLEPSNVVLAEPSIDIDHIPAHFGTSISQSVHYAETPTITGYASTLFKPDLSAFGGVAPYHYTYQNTLLRPTKILIPKIAHEIDSDVVQVPVVPSIKDIEIASPILPKISGINHDLIQYAPIVPSL